MGQEGFELSKVLATEDFQVMGFVLTKQPQRV
jgi:hypothetical protein